MTARYSAKKTTYALSTLFWLALFFQNKLYFNILLLCCEQKTFSFLLLKNAKFEEHENLLLKFVQLLVEKKWYNLSAQKQILQSNKQSKNWKIEVRRDCNFYYCLLQIKRSANEVSSHWKEQLTKKLYKKVHLIGVRAGLNIKKS